jgi:hypothetical protein
MITKTAITLALAASAALVLTFAPAVVAQPVSDAPQFDAKGQMIFPADYRDWVFLSSGIDMSYTAAPAMADAHMFNNVFVQRSAYAVFKQTGVWPDGTILMLENRGGASKGSINKRGVYQTTELMGLEAHVKDSKRFDGGWAFVGFDGAGGTGQQIPQGAACYTCHQQHAAADTTFVQFYPTLLPIATKLGTLSKAYLAETAP